MNTKETILITGVGGAAGVFLISHLQKLGLKVVAVDANAQANGLLYADRGYVVPSCLSKEYLQTIQRICIEEKVKFILPLIDEELLMMKSLEGPSLHVLCPRTEFIRICLDKYILMQRLEKIGVFVPKTCLLTEEPTTFHFPFIVKPRTGRGSRNVYVINDFKELIRLREKKGKYIIQYIIQEKIEGDEYTVSVVCVQNNQLISVVPKKIILKKGITNIAVTEKNSLIEEMSQKVIDQLHPHNSFNVQLIINKKNGKPHVFEINPRYSTTTTLTVQSGVDEIFAPIEFANKGSTTSMASNFQENLILIRGVQENFLSLSEYEHRIKGIIPL
jgi:carbamoyl-phosphate synthase large subunit